MPIIKEGRLISWTEFQEFVEDFSLLGRDLKVYKPASNEQWRGPIVAVQLSLQDNTLAFWLDWSAVKKGDGEWEMEVWSPVVFGTANIQPETEKEDVIHFKVPEGWCYILARGNNLRHPRTAALPPETEDLQIAQLETDGAPAP